MRQGGDTSKALFHALLKKWDKDDTHSEKVMFLCDILTG